MEKIYYLVIDEKGEPIFSATWPLACHEHINDAINEYDIEGAKMWRVIPVKEVEDDVLRG